MSGATLSNDNITDERRAKILLQEERDFVNAVLDAAGCLVIVLDQAGHIVRFNHACERTSGYSQREVTGRKFWDFLLLPEETKGVRAVFEALRVGHFPNSHENHWIGKDGSRRLIQWSNTCLVGAGGQVKFVIGTGIDITKQKQAEMALKQAHDQLEEQVTRRTGQLTEANLQLQSEIEYRQQAQERLHRSEARYRSLYHNTPVMMHSIDSEGRIVSVNDHWLRTLGYKRYEVLGRCSTAFLTDVSRQRMTKEVLPRLFDQGAVSDIEYQMVKKDGRVIDVSLSAVTEPDIANGTMRSLAFLVDTTEQKRIQEKTLRHQGEMAYMARLSTVGELAAGLAHEINQPLTAICNYTQCCVMEMRDGRVHTEAMIQTLDKVSAQCVRVSEIVRRLRNLVGKGEPLRAQSEANHIVREAIALITPHAQSQGIAITLELSDRPLTIEADSIQIEQVILNLTNNAIEAMNNGQSHRRRLTIRTARLIDGSVEVACRDLGAGLPCDASQRIFEPFFTTKRRGMGMGLSISRTIVEAHGGRITAKSNPDGGATFAFTLPGPGRSERRRQVPPLSVKAAEGNDSGKGQLGEPRRQNRHVEPAE